PEAQAARTLDDLASGARRDHGPRLRLIARVATGEPPQLHRLPPRSVALAEGEAIGQVLFGVPVQVELDGVAPLRMEAQRCVGPSDRRVDVEDEGGTHLPAEHIEVGDVESGILATER